MPRLCLLLLHSCVLLLLLLQPNYSTHTKFRLDVVRPAHFHTEANTASPSVFGVSDTYSASCASS